MTNMQAALGVAQLERLDEFVTRKRRMGQRYTELLSGIPGLELTARADGLCREHLLGVWRGSKGRGALGRRRGHASAADRRDRHPPLFLANARTTGFSKDGPLCRRFATRSPNGWRAAAFTFPAAWH